MSFGPNPWQQQHWDARAAANFMAGGAGSGLVVFNAIAGGPRWAYLVGAALVCLGLFAVLLEIGRPLRALNVFRHAGRSWMTREALASLMLLSAVGAAWLGVPLAGVAAALAALAFAYCQARMLRAAKGIPAWREPSTLPLLLATGLAEGAGAGLLLWAATGAQLPALWPAWGGFALALLARQWLWSIWRRRLRAAPQALASIDRAGQVFKAATLLPLAGAVVAAAAPATPALASLLQGAAGGLALAGGLWFKYTLVTRAGFNQGFSIPHLPVRGVRRG